MARHEQFDRQQKQLTVKIAVKTEGHFTPKNLVHLWLKILLFSRKIRLNPFVLKKFRTLFPMSEVPLGQNDAILAGCSRIQRGALHSLEKAYEIFSEWIFLENKRIFAKGVRDLWE